jgi:hypothetical protein
MEAVSSSETVVTIYHTLRSHDPEGNHFYKHRSDNLKAHMTVMFILCLLIATDVVAMLVTILLSVHSDTTTILQSITLYPFKA